MKVWAVAAWVCGVAAVWMGCNATTRYQVLSRVFDGVPTPVPTPSAEALKAAAAASVAPPRRPGFYGHGPYAAKLCNACHQPGEISALVAPPDQLCFRCHEIKMETKYVHGPLASGGCTACHDPHSSKFRYLLLSDLDTVCFHCHERQTVAKIAGHADIAEKCTDCHNPHGSDKKYLLR